MISGFIFDLDGVIIHTDEMHYLAWKEIADRLSVPFDRTVNNRLRGVSRMECVEIIANHAGLEFSQAEKQYLASEKNNLYRSYIASLSENDVSADVRQTLDALKKAHIKLAIGSSSKNAEFILERIGLGNYFDAVSDGNNISHSKPDPEVFLKAAEYILLPPNQCAVVEDAIAGIDAANAGGFFSIGIGDAAGYDQAKLHIKKFSEILNLIQI